MGKKGKKRSLKKIKKSLKKKQKKTQKEIGDLFALPYSTIKDHLTEEQKGMFCTSNPENVYIRFNQPSCKPGADGDSQGGGQINCEDQLDIYIADKAALQSDKEELQSIIDELYEELSKYVHVDTVNSIMNNKFCAPYSQLEENFNYVKGELNKCQTAYNSRTDQLNEVYERYKGDVKKYHETIKTIIDGGDASVVNEEKQQIYKEESLVLQEKIRKNWRKLYIVLVILIVVIVICSLKFFDFI